MQARIGRQPLSPSHACGYVFCCTSCARWLDDAAHLQVWRAVHLPKRGSWTARPMVHAGFYGCWRRNGFDKAVCDRIAELLQTGELERGHVRFLITGADPCSLHQLILVT